MKQLRVLLLRPGWDGTHLYTWVERDDVIKVKSLVQGNNMVAGT